MNKSTVLTVEGLTDHTAVRHCPLTGKQCSVTCAINVVILICKYPTRFDRHQHMFSILVHVMIDVLMYCSHCDIVMIMTD